MAKKRATRRGWKDPDESMVECANCQKRFLQSGYSKLCDAILKHKPVCSYKCNKALGQVR